MVCFKKSTIHGLGGFAVTDIPAGTRIIEYVGDKIDKGESLRRCEMQNHFIFTLDDEHDLDGDVSWNPAKLINHSCDPNCESDVEGGRVWILAKRDIEAGEELTYNYGYDLDDYLDHPCACGSPKCVGYIVAEELADQVRSKRRRQARRVRVSS
jgi:hypothetical protein